MQLKHAPFYLEFLIRGFNHDYKDLPQLKADIMRIFLMSKKDIIKEVRVRSSIRIRREEKKL